MSYILGALLAVMATVLAAVPAAAEKRIALVVGNSAYVHANQLANPANDAADMAAALRNLGFELVVGTDLDKRSFDLKIRDFARGLAEADVGLFFYAGHALQVAGQNYLVPVDAKLDSERDLDFETVRLEFVLRQMEIEREGKTNLVFLDACRDNPLTRNLARSMGTRSAGIKSGLAQAQTGVGTFISYSTQPGNVALDGKERNSPFTAALLKHVKVQGRNLTAVMIDVRKDVLTATGGKQVPWDHSALTGDFYFHPASALSTVPRPAPPSGADDMTALQERMRQLEEQLKRKSDAAATAVAVQLAQLKDRTRRLEEDTRADFQQIWDLQRSAALEGSPTRKDQLNQEASRIHMRIARRGQEQKNVRAQIERLEAEIAGTPDAPATGQEAVKAAPPAPKAPAAPKKQ